MNEHYLHPALLGRYPPELKEIFGDAWPEFPPQDFDLIVQPLDFVGINYYTRSVNRASDSYPTGASPVPQPQGTYTETGWEVFPQGLPELLLWFKQAYGDSPLYVTAHGAAFFEPPVADVYACGSSRVPPPRRTDHLRYPLRALHAPHPHALHLAGHMH